MNGMTADRTPADRAPAGRAPAGRAPADRATTANASTERAPAGNNDRDYYDVWLSILERTSRPRFRALIMDRAGVTLDDELMACLIFVDVRGPIGVLELAELVERNHPKVSRALARLERAGLISRGESATDRRVKTATATPKGHGLIEAVNQGRRRVLAEVFADWSERDRAELARLTLRFADGIFALVDSLPPSEAALPPGPEDPEDPEPPIEAPPPLRP
jgi:DNA-binding MarR family transcriptional regulator